jgi:hypothetical protein
MRDNQRQAVYRWGWKLTEEFPELAEELSLQECAELVDKVWYDYVVYYKAPRVKDGRGRRRAYGSIWDIALPRWTRTVFYVFHEVAHSIISINNLPPSIRGLPAGAQKLWVQSGYRNVESHGREYASLLLELLGQYGGVDMVQARKMGINQKPRRVHFAPANACPRPLSREYKSWLFEMKRLEALIEKHKRNEPKR